MAHIKFLHISDTHYLNEYGNALEKWGVDEYDPKDILTDFLESYNFTGIDFMVITGDLIHDGDKDDYQGLKSLLERFVPEEVPVFVTLGNHDKKTDFYQGFLEEDREGPYHYVEEFNGYRLIFLDTASEEIHDGIIDEDQVQWVYDQLDQPSKNGSLIFQHHPLDISFIRGLERTQVPDDYVERLEKTDLLAIFTGHLHQNRHVNIASIPQHTASAFVFGMNRIDNEIWNTNRLGYSEVDVYAQQVDVYTEIIYPKIRKTTNNIL